MIFKVDKSKKVQICFRIDLVINKKTTGLGAPVVSRLKRKTLSINRRTTRKKSIAGTSSNLDAFDAFMKIDGHAPVSFH
jgi:hypothetical protein